MHFGGICDEKTPYHGLRRFDSESNDQCKKTTGLPTLDAVWLISAESSSVTG